MGWARTLAEGQLCRIVVLDVRTGERTIVHTTSEILLEAPNWTVEDELILNGDGVLWRMPADGSAAPSRVAITGIPELNNDHVLAPDAVSIHLSGNDGHLYTAPLAGGAAIRVTTDPPAHLHFLHGASPDGSTLAYVALRVTDGVFGAGSIRLLRTDGVTDLALTDDEHPDDGCEYTPAGDWILFNTERFSVEPGHAQIARMRPDGTGITQLSFDERVNWFPHPDPTGPRTVYLSYPPGTTGHPADLPVELRLVEGEAWDSPRTLVQLMGGQGTINVNSWSPDGTRIAYVDYPQISGAAS